MEEHLFSNSYTSVLDFAGVFPFSPYVLPVVELGEGGRKVLIPSDTSSLPRASYIAHMVVAYRISTQSAKSKAFS